MRNVIALDGLSREDWLNARRQGIGSSDVAAICGLSPYRSALSVYADKIGTDDEDGGSAVMRLGQHLEQGILDAYASETGATVEKPTHLYGSDVHEFMLASPDGFTERNESLGVVEAKWSSRQEDWQDGPPEGYQLQVLHQLAVTDLDFGDLAALVGRDLRVYRIERDDALIDNLISIEAEFWARVMDRRPPRADSRAEQALKRLYKHGGGKPIELDVEATRAVRELRQAKKELKAAEERHDELANLVRAALGDHDTGTVAGVPVVKWGLSVRSGLDTKRLKLERPDIAAEYMKDSPVRTLRLGRELS